MHTPPLSLPSRRQLTNSTCCPYHQAKSKRSKHACTRVSLGGQELDFVAPRTPTRRLATTRFTLPSILYTRSACLPNSCTLESKANRRPPYPVGGANGRTSKFASCLLNPFHELPGAVLNATKKNWVLYNALERMRSSITYWRFSFTATR